MSESFDLIVDYNGRNYVIQARFMRLGYVHQFHININGSTLIIEFDEECKHQVIEKTTKENMDAGLIEAIIEKISSLH